MDKQKITKISRNLVGVVVSAQRDKTIAVKVTRRIKHPLYGKYITRSSKLHAHDEKNAAAVGDQVSIGATKPISKTKFYKLVDIKRRASE